jgi:hypothetical protein
MSQYSRRTVVRGAAWSIPVVAVAANAPAFAASTDPPAPGSFTACRDTGLGSNCHGYRITAALDVQPGDAWDIQLTEVRIADAPLLDDTSPQQFVVTTLANLVSFNICGNFSAAKIKLTLRYTATNQRTGASTPKIGGVYEISNIPNKCAGQ